MTNEELVICIKRGNNAIDSLEVLYRQNKNYIYKIAQKYAGYVETDDLMQEGFIGLYEAAKRYEGGQEVKFLTYATYWIRNYMEKYIENQAYTMRIPRDLKQKVSLYKKVVNAYELHLGRKPTDIEICYHLDISSKRLDGIKQCMKFMVTTTSLDSTVYEEDNETTVGDTVSSNEYIEEEIIDRITADERKELWDIVREYTNDLENKVITLRYRQNKTLQAIANEFKCSLDFVKSTEVRAINKLQRPRVQRLFRDRFDSIGSMPMNSSLKTFKNTWTSSTEKAAMHLYNMG